MRERSEKCVVTFRTTSAAMAMEAACKASGLPGRLIPVPRSVSAGCGLAWASPPERREELQDLAVQKHLELDGIYAIIL